MIAVHEGATTPTRGPDTTPRSIRVGPQLPKLLNGSITINSVAFEDEELGSGKMVFVGVSQR